MMGSFLSRALVMVFGYAYPAYECFKTVEKRDPETDNLLFWCQYWILVALLTVCERVGDASISWLPMYGEVKLAFLVYLWYPRTKGTVYVYNSIFRPYLSKHEKEIDYYLLNLKNRAESSGAILLQKIASFGKMRFNEILLYVSSQSEAMPQTAQVLRNKAEASKECQRWQAAALVSNSK